MSKSGKSQGKVEPLNESILYCSKGTGKCLVHECENEHKNQTTYIAWAMFKTS